MTTSVPTLSFTDNGVVAPSQAEILTGVIEDIGAAFGGDLTWTNTDGSQNLSTPQGQLATSETAIIGGADDEFMALFNGVDPAYASGRMQDAIGRIYFQTRNPATSTVVPGICSGATGTQIPVGATARDSFGNIYTCTQAGTIPAGGTITLSFACNTTGPIACPAGALNEIYRLIPGWDSVTNAVDGVLGSNVENRANFEARRQQSVASNAQGSTVAIKGAVLAVSGVLDCYVIDNPLDTSAVVGGVTLAPHSVYVCVVGGAAQDIGNAIWSKKSLGCNYNGDVTVTVQDTVNYSYPYPTYSVTYQEAIPKPIYVAVQLSNNGSVPSNYLSLIQASIISAFAGTDGGTRAQIGATIFASRFYAGIASLGAWAQIINITLGFSPSPAATSLPIQINWAPTTDASLITATLV